MNYNIENNLNFNELLNNSLKEVSDNNEDTNNYDNICLLTYEELSFNYIKLDCGHCFNYLPLYNELINQKNKINTYDTNKKLSINEIKCPYCRNISDKLIPYIPLDNINMIKGINYPTKYCLKLNSCEWVFKSGKNKNCTCSNDAYYQNNSLFCKTHHALCKKQISKKNEYINIDENLVEKLYKKFKINELKNILKKNNLKLSGNKKDLIIRLLNNNLINND